MLSQITARIYGDSLMKGTVIDEVSLRYRAIVTDILAPLQSRFRLIAENRARFGATIQKGRELIDRDLTAAAPCDWALVEFGGNDCNFHWDKIAADPEGEHLPLTPKDQFLASYRQIIERLRKKAIEPVLMTLPPIDAERYFRFIGRSGVNLDNVLRWLGDVQCIYHYHESYSNAILHLSYEQNCPLVDVRSYFLEKRNFRDLVGLDGLHPTQEGYRLMGQAFADFLASSPLPRPAR